jgi:hypothetical protein
MTESEVVKLINVEIKKYFNDKLDSEIAKNLKSRNSRSRDELIITIKDSMESVFKVLWQKKDFWKTDIK